MLGIGTSFGPYEIVAAIGVGGMGEVYRARDPRLGRHVAIKVLPESFSRDRDRIARFEREARMLAALNCPGIAVIYGLEQVNGVTGLVLELVEGPTLAERIRGGALETAEALHVARQIVDAMAAAHDKGIVHRDLKPANIKITSDGIVKVLDFGLAKSADQSAASEPEGRDSPTVTVQGTEAGVILGTVSYMSPAQARGRVVDKRADIWAFGCVLYEMLTGRLAFPGETISDVIVGILAREPDWDALPATTPPHLRRLLPRLLQKDPKPRVRDIADIRVDLEDAQTARADDASARRPTGRWRLVALLSLATLALTLILGASWLARRKAVPSLSIGGRTIVTQLTNYDGSETWAAVAPDGRSFAFVSTHGGTADIWLRQVSGGEPVRLTNDEAVESELVFAPSGEFIYFTRTDGNDTSIWQVGALGGQTRKVLANAQSPSPSRDGRQLAWFRAEPSAGFVFMLSISGVDGADPHVLVRNVRAIVTTSRPAWSRDDRELAFTSGGLFEARNLSVVKVDDGRTRQVTRFDQSAVGTQSQEWLPDNRHLIVSYVASPRALAVQDIGVVDVETGVITRLTENVAEGFGGLTMSADGNRMTATSTRSLREVWKVPFGPDPLKNGRSAVRLLDASLDPMWTYVTRDGRTLLFNNALVGSRNLWAMSLDGRATPRQVTSVSGDAVTHSSFSPEGSHLAFASSATGNADIWTQNVDGSELRQLTNDPAADAWPVWSPDGRSIIFASLRDGGWETRRIPASGGAAEKFVDGFFRGDWINRPDQSGTWLVTSMAPSGLRLLDGDHGTVLWQDIKPGNAMPAFSPDARLVSISYTETRDRDAIWVYDAATGAGRVAVRFPHQFHILFRASWVDGGRAFLVNRAEAVSHVVLFDRFGESARAGR
jgi:serine/threonine protein kinase